MTAATDISLDALSARRDGGFTLVELIVGLVLTGIVLVVVFGAVLDIFGSSDRASQRTLAQRSAVKAFEQLSSDLRSARAPDRVPIKFRSPDNLRAIILNPTLSKKQGLVTADVLIATPNHIQFYAEVVRQAAPNRPECVDWSMAAGAPMIRRVYTSDAAGTCSAAPIQQTEVMPAPETARAASSAAIPTPFSFRLLAQPAPGGKINADRCTTGKVASAGSARQLNQIVGVDMDLRSFVAVRDARGEQTLHGSVAITSRTAYEYRYALGCAA